MPGQKFRFRFVKREAMRLLSHHDLMRCVERMLRRADLPFKKTGGFHPTPRFIFALSLPLGVIGLNEVAELELTEPLDDHEVLDSLNRQVPDGLFFKSVKTIEVKQSALPRRAVYKMPLPAELHSQTVEAIAHLQQSATLWVDRIRPKPRRIDIRPYIRELHVLPGELYLDLWVTGQGTAKAEEIIRALGLSNHLDSGTVLTRTDLEIHDEVPEACDAPPSTPPVTAPLEHAAAIVGSADDDDSGSATWGLSPNGPIME